MVFLFINDVQYISQELKLRIIEEEETHSIGSEEILEIIENLEDLAADYSDLWSEQIIIESLEYLEELQHLDDMSNSEIKKNNKTTIQEML
jgi:hypothetical protein